MAPPVRGQFSVAVARLRCVRLCGLPLRARLPLGVLQPHLAVLGTLSVRYRSSGALLSLSLLSIGAAKQLCS